MKDNLPRYTLRISQILLDKLAYVAEYEGRTKNKEIVQLIKKRIQEFEHIHEPIPEKNAEEKGVLLPALLFCYSINPKCFRAFSTPSSSISAVT